MRFRALFPPVCTSVILALCGAAAHAQVAPSARVGGLPIAISVGFSDYDLDYGTDRRMQGLVVRGGMNVFHGVGIDVNARTIFMNTPSQLTRMQQNTYLAGVYYMLPRAWSVRPFVRWGGGLGTIEFPSRNPLYTRDSYTVYAPSGGVEIPVMNKLSIRAEYEYQFWHEYHGPHDLTPQGATLGVTYYLGGIHRRPHPLN